MFYTHHGRVTSTADVTRAVAAFAVLYYIINADVIKLGLQDSPPAPTKSMTFGCCERSRLCGREFVEEEFYVEQSEPFERSVPDGRVT